MPIEAREALALRMAVVTCEGRLLSTVNQCLVATQCPSATVVGGFRQWRSAGRYVRKGEHGLSIWIPRTPVDDAAEPEAENQKTSFFLGTVFDVSQTEATGTDQIECAA